MKRQAILMSVIVLFSSSICLAGTITYDFNNEDLGDWSQGGKIGQWQIENGELSNEFNGFPSSDLITGDAKWDNYSIECKAKFVETFPKANQVTWAGIVIRYQDTNNNYTFGIDPVKGRANFDLEVAGTSKIWLNFPIALEKDKYYKLKAIADGDHLQFFIDDTLIHDSIDNTYGMGKIGVLVINAHVHFDDFTIKGKEIGDSNGVSRGNQNLSTTWGQVKKAD